MEPIENTPMKQTPKSNKALYVFLSVLTILIFAGFLAYQNKDKVSELLFPEEEEIVQDTTTVEPEVTIQEILEFREEIREGQRIDSVFLTMPDVILIDILMTHGTSLSNSDIVSIYESNTSSYKRVLTGAEIQKNIINPLDSAKKIPKDTLKRE